MLVVTSDHGEAFGEHGRVLHASSLYDEQIRIVDSRYKLIIQAGSPPRLFDLVADPGEQKDLAPSEPDHVGRLLRAAWAVGDGQAPPGLADVDERTRDQLEALGYLE